MSDTITITNPDHPVVQAIFLKAHLRMLIVGLKHSRMSGARILEHASTITNKPYKRGQYKQALADIIAFIEKAPRVIHN